MVTHRGESSMVAGARVERVLLRTESQMCKLVRVLWWTMGTIANNAYQLNDNVLCRSHS